MGSVPPSSSRFVRQSLDIRRRHARHVLYDVRPVNKLRVISRHDGVKYLTNHIHSQQVADDNDSAGADNPFETNSSRTTCKITSTVNRDSLSAKARNKKRSLTIATRISKQSLALPPTLVRCECEQGWQCEERGVRKLKRGDVHGAYLLTIPSSSIALMMFGVRRMGWGQMDGVKGRVDDVSAVWTDDEGSGTCQ